MGIVAVGVGIGGEAGARPHQPHCDLREPSSTSGEPLLSPALTEHSAAPPSIPILHAGHPPVHLSPTGQRVRTAESWRSLLLVSVHVRPIQHRHVSEEVKGSLPVPLWKRTCLPKSLGSGAKVLPEGGAFPWVTATPRQWHHDWLMERRDTGWKAQGSECHRCRHRPHGQAGDSLSGMC